MRCKVNSRWRLEADIMLSRARFRGLAPEDEGNHIEYFYASRSAGELARRLRKWHRPASTSIR